jgi:hypothetical protein
LLGETQIRNLTYSVIEKHIRNFKIPVHGIDLMQTFEPVYDLFQESSRLILSQSSFFLEIFLEVTSIAILHHNKDTLLRTEFLDETYHILILALLEHPHLSLNQFLQFGRINHELLGNDLDSHLTLIAFVDGLVDNRPCSLAQLFEEIVGLELCPLKFLMLHFILILASYDSLDNNKKYIRTMTDHYWSY